MDNIWSEIHIIRQVIYKLSINKSMELGYIGKGKTGKIQVNENK